MIRYTFNTVECIWQWDSTCDYVWQRYNKNPNLILFVNMTVPSHNKTLFLTREKKYLTMCFLLEQGRKGHICMLDFQFDHSNFRKGELKSEFLWKHHPIKKNLLCSMQLFLPHCPAQWFKHLKQKKTTMPVMSMAEYKCIHIIHLSNVTIMATQKFNNLTLSFLNY